MRDGESDRRPCSRCRKNTLQVYSADDRGHYCSRCLQFHTTVPTIAPLLAWWALWAIILFALAVKVILTVTPG